MNIGDSVTVNFTVKAVNGNRVVCEVEGEKVELPVSACNKAVLPPDDFRPLGTRRNPDGNPLVG